MNWRHGRTKTKNHLHDEQKTTGITTERSDKGMVEQSGWNARKLITWTHKQTAAVRESRKTGKGWHTPVFKGSWATMFTHVSVSTHLNQILKRLVGLCRTWLASEKVIQQFDSGFVPEMHLKVAACWTLRPLDHKMDWEEQLGNNIKLIIRKQKNHLSRAKLYIKCKIQETL